MRLRRGTLQRTVAAPAFGRSRPTPGALVASPRVAAQYVPARVPCIEPTAAAASATESAIAVEAPTARPGSGCPGRVVRRRDVPVLPPEPGRSGRIVATMAAAAAAAVTTAGVAATAAVVTAAGVVAVAAAVYYRHHQRRAMRLQMARPTLFPAVVPMRRHLETYRRLYHLPPPPPPLPRESARAALSTVCHHPPKLPPCDPIPSTPPPHPRPLSTPGYYPSRCPPPPPPGVLAPFATIPVRV